ncbi:MAG: flagellar hook-associated protein FlgK [Sphingomonadales bacterium]|nr:flagellar hook-associated protein FlgK [Sphingomonadales bacterium]MDE2569033.1 flagellar hook-associated protein FlgK [Sphingomonadales bacterium]
MASDLLSIAASGARAAKAALDVTSQNIANASTGGYVRRSATLAEVASSGGIGRIGDISLSGVRVSGITRNVDAFRQAEVRRTGSDLSRADAELSGLGNVQSALEQTNLYGSITGFEAALRQLTQNPADSSLRANALASTKTMADTFRLASSELDSAGQGMQFDASAGVANVNTMTAELARTNLQLARASTASSDQTALLDKRDQLLQQISGYAGITATISPVDGTVKVQAGDASGPVLVDGGNAGTLNMTTAADGTLNFDVGGAAATLSSGSIAGDGQALTKLAQVRGDLDTLASSVIGTVNSAQANGVALDGSAGQPLLSGTGAADMALAASDGSAIATAPAGAGANSVDSSNLTAMISAVDTASPAGRMNALLFDVSSTIAARTTTRDALSSIALTAKQSLDAQAGVDLDTEAANLVRFQQAFQANGKVMQVASTLFDTMLAIR